MNHWKEPVLHWVMKRSSYINESVGMEWIINDPVLGYLAPFLYILNKNKLIHLSEKVFADAKEIYYTNIGLLLIRQNQLKKILNVFDLAHIQVIPLKGAILESLLYENSGLRSMSDIDILVHPQKFLFSANLLLNNKDIILNLNNGFISLTQIENLTVENQPTEICFTNNQGIFLELHQNIVTTPWFRYAFPVKLDNIWKRSIQLTSGSTKQDLLFNRLLSPYDMLAHLCLHLALHGLSVMKSYLDVDLWIRSLPIDWEWEKFLELVNEWQIRSSVYHVFSFCVDFMDTPLPYRLLNSVDPGWLARLRVKTLISSESILANRLSLGKRYPTLVKLALIDRISILFITLLKLAFPDRNWRTHHPSKRSLAAHWLHVVNVVKRG